MFDWNVERIELLRRYHAEGLTSSEIAWRLQGGVTRNAVIGKLHRLGRTNGPRRVTIAPTIWTPERVARFKEMHGNGSPYADIAAEFGISVNAARKKAFKLGLQPRASADYSTGNHRPRLATRSGFTLRWKPALPEPSTDGACDIVAATGCLWAITPHDCDKAGHLFCNHPKAEKGPYCEFHAEMNRARPEPKAKGYRRVMIPTSLLRVA